MTFGPRLRRSMLAVHLVLSVGWVGAVAAYIPFDVLAATSSDAAHLRATYLAMDLVARLVIVPLAIAAWLSGVVISLGTAWGLIRHWWVLISLLMTTVATVVLLVETRVISSLAAVAGDPATSTDQLRALGNTLPHSVGGLILLVIVLVLNVFKPRGLTAYGWRKQRAERRAAPLAGGRPQYETPPRV